MKNTEANTRGDCIETEMAPVNKPIPQKNKSFVFLVSFISISLS